MNPITLSYANMRGEAHNISYPFRKQITDYASLADVVSHDHVCGLFADGKSGGEIVQSYRSKESFISTDVVAMDCDNSDSSPDEWETLETLATKLPGVSFCLVPSRHNMLSKGGETARPRFHIYFPLSVPISNAEEVGYRAFVHRPTYPYTCRKERL